MSLKFLSSSPFINIFIPLISFNCVTVFKIEFAELFKFSEFKNSFEKSIFKMSPSKNTELIFVPSGILFIKFSFFGIEKHLLAHL